MKKILILLLCIWSVAKAQNVPGYAYSNNGIGALRFFSNALNIPAVGTPAFASNQWVRAGAMVYDSTGGNRGVYIWTGSAWIKLIDSLNISTALLNIYNSDGTLNGDRTIDGNSHAFTIQGAANITLGAATQVLINTVTARISATNFELSGLPGSHNLDDSMMVWNPSTERLGKRPIPTSGGSLQNNYFGTIYNDSNWNTSKLASDFDIDGATASDSAGFIKISGGAGTFTQTVNVDVNQQYGISDYVTNLEYYDMWMKFQVIVKGTGIGIGTRGYQVSGSANLIGQLNTSTGVSSLLNAAPTNLTVNVGDWIMMHVQRQREKTLLTVRNITTNSSTISTYGSYIINTTTIPSIGQFAIYSIGGTYYIDSLAIKSTALKNPSFLALGDSKTAGNGDGKSFFNRWATQLNNAGPTITDGAGNSTTADWLTEVWEAASLNPKIVLMTNPSNDLRTGVNTDSTKARYYRIERVFRSLGISVYHLNAFNEVSTNVSAWAAYIKQSRSADSVIDTYDPTLIAGCVSVDNIHPTAFADSVIASIVINEFKSKNVIDQVYSPNNAIYNMGPGNTNTQPANFNISSGITRNVISGYLDVGLGTTSGSAATIPFVIKGGTNLNLASQGAGSNMYLRFMNDAKNAGCGGLIDFATLSVQTNAGTVAFNVNSSARTFFGGATSATAILQLAAGSTSIPPMKFTSGPLATGGNILAGNVEFLTDKFYGTITTGPAQKEFTMNDGTLTSGRVPFATTNGRLTDASGFTFDGTKLTIGAATNISGTATNNDATAGNVGEYVSSLIASGSAVSLTTATGANITSISLTAGDWDVEGNISFSATTATVTGTSGGVTSTSATVPTDGSEVFSGVQVTLLSENDGVTLPRKRFSLSGTTTIYLVGKCTFSAGSVSAFGSITARRVR